MGVRPWCRLIAAGIFAIAVAIPVRVAVQSAGEPKFSSKEWPAPGGDWASTRYSTLSQIATANVRQLGGAWVIDLPDRQTSRSPLLVKDGRMFVTTGQGTVLALDPATGETLWTFKPETPFSGNRGIGIGEGLLFAGLRDSNVMAISQETGKLDVDLPAWPRNSLAGHEQRSRLRQRRGRCRRLVRATTSCAVVPSASTRRPESFSGASTSFPVRASRVTRRGRRIATSGSTAAARSGRRHRSMPSSGWYIWKPGMRCRSGAASCGRATTSSTTRSSRSI